MERLGAELRRAEVGRVGQAVVGDEVGEEGEDVEGGGAEGGGVGGGEEAVDELAGLVVLARVEGAGGMTGVQLVVGWWVGGMGVGMGTLLVLAVEEGAADGAVGVANGVRRGERGEPDHDFVLGVHDVGGLLDVRVEEEVEDDVGFGPDGFEPVEVKGAWPVRPRRAARVHGPVGAHGQGGDVGEHEGQAGRVGFDVGERVHLRLGGVRVVCLPGPGGREGGPVMVVVDLFMRGFFFRKFRVFFFWEKHLDWKKKYRTVVHCVPELSAPQALFSTVDPR